MRSLTIVVVLLFVPFARTADDDGPGQKVSKAKQLFLERKYEDALKLLDEVIKKDARFAQAYQERGCTRYMKGDFKGACADFDQIIKLNYMKCAEKCAECQVSCDSCHKHCVNLLASGKKEHARTVQTCADCAGICKACAALCARVSPFAKHVLEGCANACDECGEACAKFKDDKHMADCAKACKECAAECRAPKTFNGNWQRGIALYYVGRYADGRDQFKGYEMVADNDVENTFWHFMCVYKKDGAKKAKESLLKTRPDARVPMNQVLELIQGKIKPDAVLKAANDEPETKRKGALFYAHLYLGLYHDVTGDKKMAMEHLGKAAGEYHNKSYMGEVARVHLDWLKSKK
jgi:tetratricopeptide (TPR) repeat protein